jgi:hypothetical protein
MDAEAGSTRIRSFDYPHGPSGAGEGQNREAGGFRYLT